MKNMFSHVVMKTASGRTSRDRSGACLRRRTPWRSTRNMAAAHAAVRMGEMNQARTMETTPL
jgi:hypothetical protein